MKQRLARVPAPGWIALLVVCGLTPFCGHAFDIDDTLFLRVAEQIRRHPLDFYGFVINWYGVPSPMIYATGNPPLVSYFIALVSLVAGWSERALHLAFLAPAVFAACGMHSLARNFTRYPVFAVVSVVLTPVFLVSAGTIMSDVTMLAFWVWSLVFFERGLREDRIAAFILSGVLAGLAVWSKFSALALAPLLLACGLMRKRRPGWWLITPAALLLFAAGYDVMTRELYGRGLLTMSAAMNAGMREGIHPTRLGNDVVGLGYVGGCLLPVLFYVPFLWSRRMLVPAVGAVLAGLWLPSRVAEYRSLIWRPDGSRDTLAGLQIALFLAAGIHLLALIAFDLWDRRDAASLFLVLWSVGVLVFAIGINWAINARSFLPLVPAAGILLARRLERRTEAARPPISRLAWAGAAAGALSLLVLKANCDLADISRRAATETCAQYRAAGRTLWFQGHWGFQYYMENLGAREMDLSNPELESGDIVVLPNHATNTKPLYARAVIQIGALEYASWTGVSTMNPTVGAGFFSTTTGALPFVFGPAEPERFDVFRVR